MRIDWAALGIVAVVSIVASVIFTALLAAGIRLVSQAAVAGESVPGGSRAAGTRRVGYALLGLAALVALFGIVLIVPIFR